VRAPVSAKNPGDGLHSKKKRKRGKSEKREGEKRTSVILGEKGLPPYRK
jgi:hypothetical protein